MVNKHLHLQEEKKFVFLLLPLLAHMIPTNLEIATEMTGIQL